MSLRLESLARWRWGLLAATAFALVALVPQLQLWAARGRAWQGTFASVHPDEAAYAAYVNALIDGRPRRNDPFSGRDDDPSVANVESLFSIQFIPAYAVALPARLFHLSAATVFILLAPLAAFAATLALFRFILAITRDDGFAAACALCVLAFGGLARAQLLVKLLHGAHTPYIFLLFLRRYLPAAPFPLLFILFLLTWRALACETMRARLLWSCCAGLTFALLVFSYFFFWTAALAWLVVVAVLWLLLRRDDRQRALAVFAVIATFALAALVPYAMLLARRAATTDTAQGLVHTHAPDLLRPPELICLVLAATLIVASRRKLINATDRASIFTLSLALLPLALFNQQVLTGLSLQPVHFEQFVANYVAVLAAVLAAALFLRARDNARREASDDDAARQGANDNDDGARATNIAQHAFESPLARRLLPSKILLAFALVAIGWSLVEVGIATHRYARFNVPRDEARAVALRLREIAREEASASSVASASPRSVVFVKDVLLAESFPTVAPQGVLWSPGMFAFPGTTDAENKERLYLQFYYSDVDAARFARLARPYSFALFGWARSIEGLAADQRPITDDDLRVETESYARFVETFSRERAARVPLSYVVILAGDERALSNLDRFYERDAGEQFGRFTLYHVRLRGL
jgi:hypothetical protein